MVLGSEATTIPSSGAGSRTYILMSRSDSYSMRSCSLQTHSGELMMNQVFGIACTFSQLAANNTNSGVVLLVPIHICNFTG